MLEFRGELFGTKLGFDPISTQYQDGFAVLVNSSVLLFGIKRMYKLNLSYFKALLMKSI